jgi:hypothetical protein
MKRISILFCLAFVLTTALPAAAQKGHLSLGLGGGTGGLGAAVAIKLDSHAQLYLGYGSMFGLPGFTLTQVSVPTHPGIPAEKTAVPLNIQLAMNEARALLYFYPSSSSFHFILGFHMGTARYLRGTLSSLPSDYNTVGLDIDGYLVKAHEGVMEVELNGPGFALSPVAVKPYLGIGFGRPVRDDRRVTCSIDLGFQYQGKPEWRALGESITGRTKMVQIPEETLESIFEDISSYTDWMAFWPTLSFHLYFKLF